MKTLLFTLLFIFSLASCTNRFSDKADSNLTRESMVNRKSCERGECPCSTPVGNIAHGSKITVYSKETASCQEGCGKYGRELVCNNGTLSEDIKGLFFKCVTQDCPDCTLGSNLIRSGETVDTYSVQEVGCSESCDDFKERRKCELGVLSGHDPYHYFSCKRKTCRCSLPDNSGFLSLGGQIKLYSKPISDCGKTCSQDFSQTRQCTSVTSNGIETFKFNGDDSFSLRSCQEATNCFCTLPNNLGVIAHGEVRTISSVESVVCGQQCSSQPSVTVKCENGMFKNNANLTQIVDFSSPAYSQFKYQCTPQTCSSCLVSGTSTRVPHQQTYRFAKEASPACGSSCQFLDRRCFNGSFEGDTNFSAPSCTLRSCVCAVPGNSSVSVRVGSSWPFYTSAQAQCGKTCAEISADRMCTETIKSGGTYSYAFDEKPTHPFSSCQEATGCACALPRGQGSIADGKSETLVQPEEVSCGTTCDKVPSMTVLCRNGFMVNSANGQPVDVSSQDFPYQYLCKQSSCEACQLPGYGSIPNNSNLTLFSKEILGCGDQVEQFQFLFKCENGVLLRNNSPYNPANDPNAPASWYTSYRVECPGCPLPWGGSIAIGGSVKAYKYFGTVINNCGRGCKTEVKTCLNNGQLSGDPSFTMKECNNKCQMEGGGAPPRVCLLPWANTSVTPGAQVNICKSKTVPCGQSCANQCMLGTCIMATGTFNLPTEYIYQTCTELCSN